MYIYIYIYIYIYLYIERERVEAKKSALFAEVNADDGFHEDAVGFENDFSC